MEGNPEFLSSIKISQVAKNWYETQHAMTFTALNISAKKFNSLTESEQQWIKEAVTFAMNQFYIKTVNTDEKWRNYLKQQGVVFHNVDIPILKEKAKPMVDKFVQANGLKNYIRRHKNEIRWLYFLIQKYINDYTFFCTCHCCIYRRFF